MVERSLQGIIALLFAFDDWVDLDKVYVVCRFFAPSIVYPSSDCVGQFRFIACMRSIHHLVYFACSKPLVVQLGPCGASMLQHIQRGNSAIKRKKECGLEKESKVSN